MRARVVQEAKLVLANPVVVVIDTTWKTPWRTADSPRAMPSSQISTTRMTDAAVRMPR